MGCPVRTDRPHHFATGLPPQLLCSSETQAAHTVMDQEPSSPSSPAGFQPNGAHAAHPRPHSLFHRITSSHRPFVYLTNVNIAPTSQGIIWLGDLGSGSRSLITTYCSKKPTCWEGQQISRRPTYADIIPACRGSPRLPISPCPLLLSCFAGPKTEGKKIRINHLHAVSASSHHAPLFWRRSPPILVPARDFLQATVAPANTSYLPLLSSSNPCLIVSV